MSVITIREQQQTETGFKATVTFNDRAEYSITISDPFSAEEERELEWYFEQWLIYPMLEDVKAKRAAASVEKYGEELFKKLFKSDPDIYSEYKPLRNSINQLQIEIISKTPEFQALHWEALKDPDIAEPLAVNCIMLRKTVNDTPIPANVKKSPVINLLVVTARPDEDSDVGYRTISRPLVELIDNSQLRVNIELLRPGTYEALYKHLEEKGQGYYHIIHFDTHGALLSYEEFQKGVKSNKYLFQRGYGLENLQLYQGMKAFLIFEGETKGKATPVEASELANLLTGKKIPVCILNACQSEKQIKSDEEAIAQEYRETSLGSRLMAAGMQIVVAMGYSVTVSAAKIMMQQLYQHLFDKKEITTAIRLARKELFNIKQRQAYFNYKIDLEDWLLPVVYYNCPVDLNLGKFTPEEEEKYWESVGSKYRFLSPQYGFIGRDLEIIKIEKALLKHNILLLKGMGRTGKTTLLNYLREWWQRTNFAVDVFYFGYDEKSWNLEQILFEIGKQVYDRFEIAKFQAMNLKAQVQKLASKLRTESYVLILDNLESVTGQQLAIQNTLPEEEQNKIRDFLERLVGGKTKIVFGSRSGEEWLENTFKDNVYQLQGLDPQSRSVLAEKILERNVETEKRNQIRGDDRFKRLMKLLAGYPLIMKVLLANLKTQTPKEILEKLLSGDINKDKTKIIIKGVEISHSNLSPEAQKMLLCLALFSSYISRPSIVIDYIKELQKIEQFKNYNFDYFDKAISEAINWGLLLPDRQLPEILKIQPIFPYFLKLKLKEIDDSIYESLREGFKNNYQGIAAIIHEQLISNDVQKQKAGILLCGLEYENLYLALQICLEKYESINIFFCLFQYFRSISDRQSELKLAEYVWEALKNYPDNIKTIEISLEIVQAVDRLASAYLNINNHQKAREYYLKALELTQKLTGISLREKELAIASIYHHLGIIAQELREFVRARHYYQKALKIREKHNDLYNQAMTYHHLGWVDEELRQFEQAQRNYEKALEIKIQYNDRENQASTYVHLGRFALQLKDFPTARDNFQRALNIKRDYDDLYNQAGAYYNLGLVYQELKEWEEAKYNFQQALEISIQYNDSKYQAICYSGLGNVTLLLEEYQEARNYYQKSLGILKKDGECYEQALIYHQLGIVLEKLNKYEQARDSCQQAIKICKKYGDRYSQVRSYLHLGNIAEKLDEYEEAQDNYQNALDIYIEYKECENQAQTHFLLGKVTQQLENFNKAEYHYQQALEIFIEDDRRYDQAETILRLGLLFQQIKDFQQAKYYYEQALKIFIEDNHRYQQAKTYESLGRLTEELGELEAAKVNYLQALRICVEVKDMEGMMGIMILLRCLTRIYQKTQDETILTEVASILNWTMDDVRRWFMS